jgi:pimeloyl-ACP methyl ester carboxylesterase
VLLQLDKKWSMVDIGTFMIDQRAASATAGEKTYLFRVVCWLMAAALGLVGCSQSTAQSPNLTAKRGASSAPNLFAGVVARAPDAFYDSPQRVPDRPGMLLRSEPLKNASLPNNMRGWRILYTTSIDDKTPLVAAIATVFASNNPPAGPRPVIAWQHGTMGVVQRCAPSLLSAPMSGIPAVEQIAKAGWVIVATDYSFSKNGGPQPFLIGEAEARAALDSVRAARQMPELKLDSRTVVWGHSQGGHSALWTGIVGPRYSPDVSIVGVVAIAPPGDVLNLLSMSAPLDRRLGPYIAVAYSRFYPDISFEQSVHSTAQTAAREIAKLCGFIPQEDPRRIAALLKEFDGRALTTDTNSALYARLKQNTADERITAPLLVAQGVLDAVVPVSATNAYVIRRCAAGQQLEYWTFAGQDHSSIVQSGTPLSERLIMWTKARFANEPQINGCARMSY